MCPSCPPLTQHHCADADCHLLQLIISVSFMLRLPPKAVMKRWVSAAEGCTHCLGVSALARLPQVASPMFSHFPACPDYPVLSDNPTFSHIGNPQPHAGTVFRISVQTTSKAKLPDQEWAFFEDPIRGAVAAAQAHPSAEHSRADPPRAATQHHSTSAAATAPLGSLQSPCPSAHDPAHTPTAAGVADAPTTAHAAARSPRSPSAVPPAPAAETPAQDYHATSGRQPHALERTHDVGFGCSGTAHHAAGGPPWGSQHSLGVQSQTQPCCEHASNSTQHAAGRLPASQPRHRHALHRGPPSGDDQDDRGDEGGGGLRAVDEGKRRLASPGSANRPGKLVKRAVDDHVGVDAPSGGSAQLDGGGPSPLLGSPSAVNEAGHGRDSGKGDTESYCTAVRACTCHTPASRRAAVVLTRLCCYCCGCLVLFHGVERWALLSTLLSPRLRTYTQGDLRRDCV